MIFRQTTGVRDGSWIAILLLALVALLPIERASAAVITDSAAPGKSQTVNATVKLRYLGPCPDGMSVGQIQSNEGAVIDMSNFDAAKARELAKQAGK